MNERTFRLARKGARVMAFSSPLVETASVLAFLLLLGYATTRITAGKMTLGTFISYGVGLAMMYQPFKRATRTNLALQQALASARRLFEVLDAPNDVVDRPDARPIAGFAREIVFEGVSFAYGDGEPVLADVDLALRAARSPRSWAPPAPESPRSPRFCRASWTRRPAASPSTESTFAT